MTDFNDLVQLAVPISQHDHSQGADTATIVLVEYGDYQCPDCAIAHSTVQAIQQQFGEQLRFVFRHFPQPDIHPQAHHAAESAVAAAAQGKFWAMHDYLMGHQPALEDADLVEYAIQLKLDITQFLQEMIEHIHAERVQADLEGGRLSGVTKTPTFFINGTRCDGESTLEQLRVAIAEYSDR